jgi:hypothetical protein
MTGKKWWAGGLCLISMFMLFLAPVNAQNASLPDDQKVITSDEGLQDGIIIIDEETHMVNGSVGERRNSSPAKAKDIIKTGNWKYASDEAYQDFPRIYISVIKKVAVEEQQSALSDDNTSLSHRRRSLAARSGSSSGSTKFVRKRLQEDISPIILKHAKMYQVSPYIIKAIIEVESAFNPNAISCSGACGLMQLKPGTAYDMGVRNYWNPEKNIEAGTKYIKLMLDTFGTLPVALAAYNQGPGAVQRSGGNPPNGTARHYIWKVFQALGNSK